MNSATYYTRRAQRAEVLHAVVWRDCNAGAQPLYCASRPTSSDSLLSIVLLRLPYLGDYKLLVLQFEFKGEPNPHPPSGVPSSRQTHAQICCSCPIQHYKLTAVSPTLQDQTMYSTSRHTGTSHIMQHLLPVLQPLPY